MKQVTKSALITAFYRRLLGRDPDAVGARDKMHSPLDSIADFEALIDQFLNSKELQSRTGLLRQDSSQFGEISLLVKCWTNEASRHRIVVDVGARQRAVELL